MARVLVTRALPEAEETATLLRELGHEALVAPLRSTEDVPTPFPARQPDALVATSRNALRHGVAIPGGWLALPIYCVGETTAVAARAAGFDRVLTASGDAAALVTLIGKTSAPESRLLYLAGAPRGPQLESTLQAAGFRLETLLRYRMRDLDRLPEVARAALAEDRLDAVLHFSAESARAFFKQAQSAGVMAPARRLRHACLSPAVAAAAREAAGPALDIVVAEARSGQALVEALHVIRIMERDRD